jgi:hypothetical protein
VKTTKKRTNHKRSNRHLEPLVSLRKYSVSLVYEKDENGTRTSMLRVLITDAHNRTEALGKAVEHFGDETKQCRIAMHVVLQIEMSAS